MNEIKEKEMRYGESRVEKLWKGVNLVIKKVAPIIMNVKNEPMSGVSFEQFWAVWDKLMDQNKVREASIFLVQRYNKGWNEGLD